MSWKQLREYCHHLPEWEDVGASSKPIKTATILTKLGKSETQIKEAALQLSEEQTLAAIFS
jgi:hypothetical protein